MVDVILLMKPEGMYKVTQSECNVILMRLQQISIPFDPSLLYISNRFHGINDDYKVF